MGPFGLVNCLSPQTTNVTKLEILSACRVTSTSLMIRWARHFPQRSFRHFGCFTKWVIWLGAGRSCKPRGDIEVQPKSNQELFQMIFRLCFLLSVGIFTAIAAEQTCLLTVYVEDDMHRPAIKTWVELRDEESRVVRKEQISGQPLRICDFGFGKHTLIIEGNSCYRSPSRTFRVRRARRRR